MTSPSIPLPKGAVRRRVEARSLGMKDRRAQMGLLMFVADLLGFAMAVGPVFLVNAFIPLFKFQIQDLKYSLILVICLLLFRNSKLYPGVGINPAEEMRLVTQHTSSGFLTGLVFFGMLQSPWRLNILAFAAMWIFSLITILLARWGVRIMAVRLGLWGEPVVLLAEGKQATELGCYFCQRPRLGFIPVIATNDTIQRQCEACSIPVISLDNLLASPENRFLAKGIQTVLVDSSFAPSLMGTSAGRALLRLFKRVIFLSDRDWLDGASLGVHDLEGVIGIEARKNLMREADLAFKRLLDVLLSIILGIVTSPVLLLTAILIRMSSRGAILYTQDRLGKDGRKIRIFKFRTMVEDADSILESCIENDPKARLEWEQTQKLRNDPRITSIGRFLRRYSIDELPQLFNVLAGEMSLVGPRPIMIEQQSLYGEYLDIYCGVRPGLTGFWQVSGRNHTTFEERARFDVYYVRNWSVWLDLYILLRTVWVVFSRDGAY